MRSTKLANAILDRALSRAGLMRSSLGKSQISDLTDELIKQKSRASRNKVMGILGTGGAAGTAGYNSMLHSDQLANLKSLYSEGINNLSNAHSSKLQEMRLKHLGDMTSAKKNINALNSEVERLKGVANGYFNESVGRDNARKLLQGKIDSANKHLADYNDSWFGFGDTDTLDKLTEMLK